MTSGVGGTPTVWVGADLRRVRRAAGVSQRELAQAMGVTARTVERLEASRLPVRALTWWRHGQAALTVLEERQQAVREILGSEL